MPFQGNLDDDEYTDEQRAGMYKVLRMFQKEPTREEIIKKHKLSPHFRYMNTESIRLLRASVKDEYYQMQEELGDIGLQYGHLGQEIKNRKILEKLGIGVEDFWNL